MKVVVLDDEEKVCCLILQLVDWHSMGMEVVGTAYNGIDGLALVEREKPDLVITDIRMPGLDGLELIRQFRECRDGIDFIIVSGYHQFEYAHNAIRYGVEDYLLKPIKKDELIAVLHKIAEQNHQRVSAERTNRELTARLESTLEKLRRDFFHDCVFSSTAEPVADLKMINETYGYHFREGLFQIIIIKIDCPPADYSEGMVRMIAEKARSASHAFLERFSSDLELHVGKCRIHILIGYSESERHEVRKAVKRINDELQVQGSIFEVAQVTVALGRAVEDIGRIAESGRDAETALGQRLFSQTGHLYEELPPLFPNPCNDILAVWNREIERACELLDADEAVAAANRLVRSVLSRKECSGVLFLDTVQEAGHRLFILLRNRGEEAGEDLSALERRFEHELDLLPGVDAVSDRLCALVKNLLKSMAESRSQTESRPIREARRYIVDHFHENGISLEQVAEQVGLNPSYFSLMFKRETGSGFLESLTTVRIDYAKELLRSSKHTIAQVASAVGYSDTRYFTRLFRRMVGIKPSEFRKLYG
ncbi:response regulator [Marispirochaeta sp.]|uniref:response regulator n=1 Tax=Marispirochaeta sp. TaxID=2038653 RepID=UPI0029C8FE59|nr:response regulator [Marispirochaeta sp.]